MSSTYKNIFIDGAISTQKIANSISEHGTKTGIGGHSIFLGQVRADEMETGKVTAIEYTAYKEMALEKAHEIREEIFAKYPLTCMHIYHSLGVVKTGEICLFVFTSSKHRKTAIDACAEVVEKIKKELPVWGREIIDGGDFKWKENKL
ncbi:MAG: molybdenum cofactor biosynthesis protein MoaE [Chitinophagaceae bacterium]|nr:molybdenum cofactor biosynthesis protein MoaE [Chitinophagaceae bacterium]